jgi:cell division protein ZapA
MGQVTVHINGRSYPVACEPGQEDHLARLASFINMRVQELTERLGQIGDAHLMVIAGLMIADELSEAYDRLETERKQSGDSAEGGGADPAVAARIAERLEALAGKVENIATRMESA